MTSLAGRARLPGSFQAGAASNSARVMSSAASWRPAMAVTSIGTATGRRPQPRRPPYGTISRIFLRRPHHALHVAQGAVVEIQHAQADQVAHPHRLRPSALHPLLGRELGQRLAGRRLAGGQDQSGAVVPPVFPGRHRAGCNSERGACCRQRPQERADTQATPRGPSPGRIWSRADRSGGQRFSPVEDTHAIANSPRTSRPLPSSRFCALQSWRACFWLDAIPAGHRGF